MEHAPEKMAMDCPPSPLLKKGRLISLFLLFCLIAALHATSVSSELGGLGGDNADYVLLAKSLAAGEGYRSLTPGNPQHTHFVPVFPLLMAPLIWVFDNPFLVGHLVVLVSSLVGLIFMYLFFTRAGEKTAGFLACLLFAINPFTNSWMGNILTEFPYIMLVAAAFLVNAKNHGQEDNARDRYLLPLIVAVGYMTRNAGQSLLLAFVLYRLCTRQWRLLFINLPVLLFPKLLWSLWLHLGNYGNEYSNVFWLRNYRDPALGMITMLELFDRFLTNAGNLAEYLTWFLLPSSTGVPQSSMYLLLPVILTGLLVTLKRKEFLFMNIYAAVYMALLLAWPIFEARKVLPVMPIVYFHFFMGLRFLLVTIPSRARNMRIAPRDLGAITMFLCFVLMLPHAAESFNLARFRMTPLVLTEADDTEHQGFSINWAKYSEAYEWFRSDSLRESLLPWHDYLYISWLAGQVTPEGSTMIARKFSITALMSGRPTMCYPFYDDLRQQRDTITGKKIDYLVFDGMFADTGRYLLPFIKAYPEAFKEIARKGNAILFKVDREALSIPRDEMNKKAG